ncbi:S-layer homology domain-containing protein [Cohnella suwonensis]|uniref:S-layer homology domain-containing protein n=1 Tax=Cohnella suwonensis TaxID=696072 RepID=A0ABW0LXF0_9BACL
MAIKETKKWTIIMLVFSMMFASFGFVSAAESAQSDVKGHWAEKQLNQWLEKGLIKGYADGTVKPDNPVTRAELIALINRAFGFTEKADVHFSDIASGDWAYDEAAKAVKAGYMKGNSDGTFGGNRKASRQEVAAIIARLLNLQGDEAAANAFSDAAKFAPWSRAAIGAAVSKKLMQGYGDQTFRPEKSITRAEAVVTLDRSLQALQTQTETQKNAYNAAGTYGPATGTETVSGDVAVNVPGVTLQNMVINGNLLLAAGIGSGDAFLKNVTVKGTTTVQGGGDHSIHFENGKFVKVIVDKKDSTVRLVLEGTTFIEQLDINSPVNLEMGKDSNIGTLIIDALLKMLGQGTIEKAIISDDGQGSTFEKQPQKLEGSGAPTTPSSGGGGGGGNVLPALSSAKDITAFSFPQQAGAATIDSNARTVDIQVINGTNLNGLVASFSLSTGATAKVGAVVQTNGTTSNDFSIAVTYTVTAQDNTTQNWKVVVSIETIPALTATAKQGTTPGYSQLTNVAAGSGNHLYVLPSASILTTPNVGEAAPNGNAAGLNNYVAETEFPASSFVKYVHIYEVDSAGKVVKFQLITLTPAEIKPIPIGDQAPIASANAAPGSAPGTTKIIATPFGSGNHIAIEMGIATVGMVNVGDSLPTGLTVLNNYMGEEIAGMDITTNKYIVVYEVDYADKVVAYNEIVLTALDITQVGSPLLSATVLPGTSAGATSVTATVSNPLNHLVIYGSDSVIVAPNIGGSVPNGSNVGLVSPYTSGADISFMDAVTNKYLAVYEANNGGAIVKYQLITLTSGDFTPVPAPGFVSVTPSEGSVVGTTKIGALPVAILPNHLVVKVSSVIVATPNIGDAVPTGVGVTNPYIDGINITAVDASMNKYVAVYEADSSNKVVRFALITLTSADIKQLVPVPSLSAEATPGTITGTKVAATVGTADNYLTVKVSSASLPTPNVGDTVPISGSQGVTSPYTSGNDITGVDAITNKFVAVYESNSVGKVVAFELITLTAANINGNLAPLLTTASATAGTVEGSTSITATIAGANHLAIKFSNEAIATPNSGEDAPLNASPDWSVLASYTQGSDILFVDDTTNKYLGVYEVDSSNKVVSFKLITLIASEIKSYTSIPSMTAFPQPGVGMGATKIQPNLTMWGYFNHLVVKVSSVSIATPNVGALAPTGAGVINPYGFGDDITGVDATTNKYIAVYEANAAGLIVRYKLITLAAQDITQISSAITASPSTLSEAIDNNGSSNGSLTSGVITVTAINGGTFNPNIAKADVALTLPNSSATINNIYGYDFTVALVDSTHITVTITGVSSYHTADDSFDFVITVLQSKVNGAASDVTTNPVHVTFS